MKWFYILQYLKGRKYLRRIDAETGARERTGYEVTAFPFIIGSDNEQDRSIYFVTYQGYVFALREPQ